MTAKSLVRDELKGVTWHSYVRLIGVKHLTHAQRGIKVTMTRSVNHTSTRNEFLTEFCSLGKISCCFHFRKINHGSLP